MTVSSLPQTAPFADDERVSLNRVLSTSTATQRAWLSGFLAGIDAQSDGGVAQAAPPRAAAPLTIVFATESGNSEALAHDAAKAARKNGFKPKVVDMADLVPADLARAGNLLVVAATWGEGEPPGRAAHGYRDLMAANVSLADVRYGVLALGDTAYAEFCAIGRAIDTKLEELGAQRVVDRIDCDLDFAASAEAWIKGALATMVPPEPVADNVVAVDFRQPAPGAGREIVAAEVAEHINLNSSRSDKETIHLALAFEGAAPAYEPGDSLEIYPQNDPALVDQILTAARLSHDDVLRQALHVERDITTLSAKTIEAFATATGHSEVQRMVAENAARAWVEGRQLIDLLEAFPAPLAADHLHALTRPLPPRAYSIASSRREYPDEAHLLVSAVRYDTHDRRRHGVASTFVADLLQPGAHLKVRLRPNKHFRLPAAGTDIIMVGPGTGVAPFRAFVQERRAEAATGRSWLFFGDRHFTHDFLYQLEWQDALKDGSLSRLDLAFSRDTPEKVYVQHRLWEARRDLVAWLDGGAVFYVCGDANAMAKDVRAALVRSFADVKALSPDAAEAAVVDLERGKRYLQDVY